MTYPTVIVNLINKCYIIHGNPRTWTEVPMGSKLEDFPQYAVQVHESAIPITLKREHKVASSKPGKYYIVTQDGKYYNCTCTGFLYRNRCKHVDQIKQAI